MSTSTYPVYRRRGGLGRLVGWADDFMSWFLYGHETWLVAVLKGVPLFLFVYFLMTYVPNYVYYLITVELPFLRLERRPRLPRRQRVSAAATSRCSSSSPSASRRPAAGVASGGRSSASSSGSTT